MEDLGSEREDGKSISSDSQTTFTMENEDGPEEEEPSEAAGRASPEELEKTDPVMNKEDTLATPENVAQKQQDQKCHDSLLTFDDGSTNTSPMTMQDQPSPNKRKESSPHEKDIMQILTESEINSIKRSIGTAFYNRLKLAQIQIILRKEPNMRREAEIDLLVEKLKTFSSLKDKKLGYADYRHLSQVMTYKEMDADSLVYDTGS